ncbi:ATP-binding protein [Flavobacterium sp. GSA192]|uniref:ATP-binding protein n=1 Tax=Flavobacterium sp. GSA192 TaxID=2576304 RepID=UPI0011265A34|nr:ATP-binding protein [Flavobacterium sp. GSA192]
MNELYQSLGLKNNLFSKFSAEEEEEYLNDIYVQPKYFNSLYSNLKGASSRFIIGSRGSGKTALILQLKKSLEENNVYTFLLDNFENIPNKDNERHFILEIIQGITSDFSLTLSKNPKLLKNLDKFEKEKLSFIIQEFFKTLSKREYLERNDKIKRFKTKNAFLEFFNSYLNKPVNLLVSGGIEIISDTVAKSLGLPKVQNDEFYKNYIPDFKTKIPEKKISFDNYDYNSLKNILIDLSKIIRKVGYHSVVIMIDKIDENRNLRGSINDVCNFIEEILKDTNLLMQSDFGVVFSIWDEVRNVLASRGVRFDKFRPIDVTWTSDEIIEIINKRIGFFSDKTNNIQDLLVDSNEKDGIIKLANNSPRDLFHLFANIYDEQSVIDSNSTYFSREAINSGKLKFCKEYEYYALFPSNRNSKDDVFRNINRLLKTGKTTLRSNDIASVLKVNPATANTYIKIMSDFNFIKMTDEQYVYNIIDPKIKHLIENKTIEI